MMTTKEIKKRFKEKFGRLPMPKSKYIELLKNYKIKQAESNKALAPILEEKSLITKYDAVCNFEGMK